MWLVVGCALAPCAAAAGVGVVGERASIGPVAPDDRETTLTWEPLDDSLVTGVPLPLAMHAVAELRGRFGADAADFAIGAGIRHGHDLSLQRLRLMLETQRVPVLPVEYDAAVATAGPGASTPTNRPGRLSATARGGRVYVTNERSAQLSVLDPATRKVQATIPLGKRPRGLALAPDGRFLYIALHGAPAAGTNVDAAPAPARDTTDDGIGVVDVTTLRLVHVLRGVTSPEQLVVSRDGRKLYVTSADTGTAVVLDTANGRPKATLTVGRAPEGVAISHDGRWVYVSSEADDELSVIDTHVDAVTATIPTCARPRAIVFARTRPRAYVSCEKSAEVALIDVFRQREVARLSVPGLGARPMGVALSPDEKRLYVATGRGGTLVALSVHQRYRVIESVAVGQRPWGISISADGSRIYTANGPSNDVSIVDAASMRVVERVAVGSGPWHTLVHDDVVPRASSESIGRPGSVAQSAAQDAAGRGPLQ
jgi:YVTN family beta-propeller protein